MEQLFEITLLSEERAFITSVLERQPYGNVKDFIEQFKVTDDEALKLKLHEVNFTLQALAQLPYNEVKGLIEKITEQGNAQLPKSEQK